jgi:hypothetical protein
MGPMDWSPIVTTALGGVLAVVGGFAGQWWSERNATAREREVWAGSLLYEAHVAFLSEYDRCFDTVWWAKLVPDGSQPHENFLEPLWDRQQAVRLVCTDATADAGERARRSTLRISNPAASEAPRNRSLVAKGQPHEPSGARPAHRDRVAAQAQRCKSALGGRRGELIGSISQLSPERGSTNS